MSLNGGLATALNMVISLLITLMAVVATARLFLDARKATVLRRTMWTNKGGRKHWPFFVIWLAAIYLLIVVAEAFLPSYAGAIVYANLIPVPFLIYFLLGLTFPDRLPIEGALAIISYEISAIMSLIVSLPGMVSWGTSIITYLWTITALIWISASILRPTTRPGRIGGAGQGMKDDDALSETTALAALRKQLADASLKSSARILILASLALNRKMTFMNLLTLTGIGKGSLSFHLEKLESSNYITIRTKATFSGDRTMIEITEKGKDAYNSLVQTLSSFQKK